MNVENQNTDSPLVVRGEHDGATVEQMWRCLGIGSAAKGVLCADGHLGYAQPVGGVIAYDEDISISGVGFDIACGNMAVKTDMTAKDISGKVEGIAKNIAKSIDFGVGGSYARSRTDLNHRLFDDEKRWKEAGVEDLKDMAYAQLGTVGGGNHYVDVFIDDADGHVWVGVHFGSRGLGHKTATRYLQKAGGKDGMHVAPALVSDSSDLGEQYFKAMELAGDYAYAGREFVVNKVVKKILGAKVLDSIHNHHNYAWRETHGGRDYWVVRKGATPAFPGQRGFVGGSMGDNAVIVEGVDSDESKKNLYSTIHGAGRLFSRSVAKKSFVRSQMDEWLAEKGVTLIGGDLDESPMAYRRLDEVLKHHGDTIKVNHVLRPIIVVMSGRHTRDPYKD